MTVITTEIVVKNDRKIHLELPLDSPLGPATMTLTFKTNENQPLNRAAEVYGQGRGQVWMAKDFNASLDDFAEYM
jgi:hypothetical protein